MSRRNSFSSSSTGAPSETLDNIRRVTESTESCLGYYYKNDAGDLVLVNMYDISDTDPAELLGADLLDQPAGAAAALPAPSAGAEADFGAARHLGDVDPTEVEHRLRKKTHSDRWQQQANQN